MNKTYFETKTDKNQISINEEKFEFIKEDELVINDKKELETLIERKQKLDNDIERFY